MDQPPLYAFTSLGLDTNLMSQTGEGTGAGVSACTHVFDYGGIDDRLSCGGLRSVVSHLCPLSLLIN